MIDVTIDTQIDRPVTDVFAYVTDPAKLRTWQATTMSAVPEESGPLRVGSRVREVHRGPGGREMPSVVEVTAMQPGAAFDLRVVEGPLPIHADITFDAVDGGTHLRFRAHGQPTGMLRLLQPVLRRALRKQFAQDCATLKDLLERSAAGS